MKTAIYIEDGVVQLVVTPESEFEKNALTSFMEHDIGVFYDCRGGWARQKDVRVPGPIDAYSPTSDDKSIIIRVNHKADVETT